MCVCGKENDSREGHSSGDEVTGELWKHGRSPNPCRGIQRDFIEPLGFEQYFEGSLEVHQAGEEGKGLSGGAQPAYVWGIEDQADSLGIEGEPGKMAGR